MTHLSPSLRAELAKLDDLGLTELLGEILEPSQHGPFAAPNSGPSDDLADAMYGIVVTYRRAYPLVMKGYNP